MLSILYVLNYRFVDRNSTNKGSPMVVDESNNTRTSDLKRGSIYLRPISESAAYVSLSLMNVVDLNHSLLL